ncbi:hypothetical protein AB3Y13_17000 [Vibrio alginolyticus]
MNTNRQFPKTRAVTVVLSLLTLMFSMSAFARLDGAIFTTTPLGDIVNENVHFEFKEHVFLDGGPGPQAPRTAASLPAGLYYFQVTDPAGKCLLSSTLVSADTNGGTCYEDVKIRGKSAKNADEFYAEPLACRLFYFDGEGGVTFMNDIVTITQEVKIRGKMETQSIDIECRHQLGSEYLDRDPSTMPDGDTIQLYPFANTPNSGGVYKAWVSTAESVEAACEGTDLYGAETGENCDGFFGFIPRFSKTDNFKARINNPVYFDIALRAFHDKNLSCQYDDGDEIINAWELGFSDLDDSMGGGVMRNTTLTNDSPDEPVRFSVYDLHDHSWSVDQYMWQAKNGIAPMNTPFTHFPTFAELKYFAPTFDDGDLLVGFTNALACNPDGTVRRTADEDTSFIPGNFAEPDFNPEPKLTVRFGSTGFAKLKVCKSFDKNGNGMHDEGEELIGDWPVTLKIPESAPVPKPFTRDGNAEFAAIEKLLHDAGVIPLDQELAEVDENGYVVRNTGDDGCATFYVLVPNVRGEYPEPYEVSEDVVNLHTAWMSTSAYEVTFDVESVLSYVNNAPVVEGVLRNRSDGKDAGPVYFNNVCKVTVDFDTKGYWHNKNGLQELTEADRTYVNGLAPYSSPSLYFGDGDEPFDGKFDDGGDVDAAFSGGSMVWEAGTWQSEVSQFLVDNNGNSDIYDHKEQLAQQLLAFIFNTRHRPTSSGLSPDTKLWIGGEWVSIGDIISRAISAWQGSNDSEIVSIKDLLDWLNNNNEIKVLVSSPDDCPAPYDNE